MRKTAFGLLLAASVLAAGCAVAPFVGPIVNIGVNAYVAWSNGEATAYYATNGNTAYNAVKRVLDQMEYPITTDKQESDKSYYIVAGSNNKFHIRVTQVEPYVTSIKIRIDFMGDKPYAEMIYRKLEPQLDVIDYSKHRRRFRH